MCPCADTDAENAHSIRLPAFRRIETRDSTGASILPPLRIRATRLPAIEAPCWRRAAKGAAPRLRSVAAGFASHAHMTTTFRDRLGLPPSRLRTGNFVTSSETI
jgi:hypothetical protein